MHGHLNIKIQQKTTPTNFATVDGVLLNTAPTQVASLLCLTHFMVF